jgi:rhomboid protease GluP
VQVVITETPHARPVVTYTLLVITVIIWLVQMGTKYLWPHLDIPAELGAKINEAIRAGQVWRLFTPMFLHDDTLPIHILANMYFLAIVGTRVERYTGHLRFLLLYVLAAFAGNTLSFFFSPYHSLGASTALFGMLAAEGVFVFQNKVWMQDWNKALNGVISVLLINLFLGLMIHLDNWGHIGGLLGGAMFAWFAGPQLKADVYAPGLARIVDRRSPRDLVTASVLVLLVFGALAAAGFFWGVPGIERGL